MQSTTVLVEGESDRLAVEALAALRGYDIGARRVSVVPMGGATSIVHFLERYGPKGAGHRLLGLCDSRESPGIARALSRAGLGSAHWSSWGFRSVMLIWKTNSSVALALKPCSASSKTKVSSRRSSSFNASLHCGTSP